MKILVSYATNDGHTRKIGRHVSDRIADAGHTVELLDLANATDIDLGRFDGALLAASVHMGHYQRSLTDFVDNHLKGLKKVPTLFLSVSLSAAGHDTDDWTGLDRTMKDFIEATGWKPDRVEQVAGAYMPSQYDIFRRFIMRRIIASKDSEADLGSDHDYTDWRALDGIIDRWQGEVVLRSGTGLWLG